MSFKAELVVQGETFDILEFSWVVKQQLDRLGRPDARVQGGTLEITLAAQPNDLLQEWATSHTRRWDGVVQVREADSAAILDTVRFFAAHCVSLQRSFQDAHAARGTTMVLSLSANQLQYGELAIHNRWPGVEAS